MRVGARVCVRPPQPPEPPEPSGSLMIPVTYKSRNPPGLFSTLRVMSDFARLGVFWGVENAVRIVGSAITGIL